MQSSGNKINSYSYNAFGVEENPSALDDNPFRYCGEYFDKVNEKIYLRARYYDVVQGRFTQEDPIRDGYNWYIYCENNPIMFIDPTGYAVWECFGDDTDILDSPDMKWMGSGGGAKIISPYDSTSYGNYMVRTKVANYDAITGGYHSDGISFATANPDYYALDYEPTVRDNPATNEPWMKISTGRTIPKNVHEQMVMDSVKENPQKGNVIIDSLGDPRLPPHTQKMQVLNYSSYGNVVTIHYNYSAAYQVYFDFKFKP